MPKNKMQDAVLYPGRSKKCIDSIGKTFGYLTVTGYLGYRLKKTGVAVSVVEAKCICGSSRRYDIYIVSSGQAKSCGCMSGKIGGAKRTKHGHTSGEKGFTPEYAAWLSMKFRCYKKTMYQYKDYGGRGIIVCDRWLNSFESFLSDMGYRPSLNHSLDRYPNRDGNYEPNNCRWATREEQMNNTRRNTRIIYNGETLTLSQAMKKYGLSIWQTRLIRMGKYNFTKIN